MAKLNALIGTKYLYVETGTRNIASTTLYGTGFVVFLSTGGEIIIDGASNGRSTPSIGQYYLFTKSIRFDTTYSVNVAYAIFKNN